MHWIMVCLTCLPCTLFFKVSRLETAAGLDLEKLAGKKHAAAARARLSQESASSEHFFWQMGWKKRTRPQQEPRSESNPEKSTSDMWRKKAFAKRIGNCCAMDRISCYAGMQPVIACLQMWWLWRYVGMQLLHAVEWPDPELCRNANCSLLGAVECLR